MENNPRILLKANTPVHVYHGLVSHLEVALAETVSWLGRKRPSSSSCTIIMCDTGALLRPVLLLLRSLIKDDEIPAPPCITFFRIPVVCWNFGVVAAGRGEKQSRYETGGSVRTDRKQNHADMVMAHLYVVTPECFCEFIYKGLIHGLS